LALFTAANWSAFVTPTTLSVIFASVEAPLGLVLLGVVVLLAAMFLIYVVYLQSSVLFETRRHARELHSQRELAEHAEISRIHDLRTFLETQLQTLGKQTEQSNSELSARLEQLEGEVRQSIEHCQNSLAASMAEIDDRLKQGAGESQTRKLA
jgi:uncharacterized integral membrane protein